jgi:hypothetical protein
MWLIASGMDILDDIIPEIPEEEAKIPTEGPKLTRFLA